MLTVALKHRKTSVILLYHMRFYSSFFGVPLQSHKKSFHENMTENLRSEQSRLNYIKRQEKEIIRLVSR